MISDARVSAFSSERAVCAIRTVPDRGIVSTKPISSAAFIARYAVPLLTDMLLARFLTDIFCPSGISFM